MLKPWSETTTSIVSEAHGLFSMAVQIRPSSESSLRSTVQMRLAIIGVVRRVIERHVEQVEITNVRIVHAFD